MKRTVHNNTFSITIVENKTKDKYQNFDFDTFEELVTHLQNNRANKLANAFGESNSSKISSEVCNNKFIQDNFEYNGRIVILDFNKSLTLNEAKEILALNNFNYYIYNSHSNGENNTESFRIILPLNRQLKDKYEIKSFLKSLNKIFNETANTKSLTSCSLVQKPQHWKSTTKGKEFNNNVIDINETKFDALDVNVEKVFTEYPSEVIKYNDYINIEFEKIDTNKQVKFVQDAKELYLSSNQENKYEELNILAKKLKSYGLNNNEIYLILDDVFNEKNNHQYIDTIIKSLGNEVQLNPSVFRDEYYQKFVIDKLISKYNQNNAKCINVSVNNKIADLNEFKDQNIFIESGINVFNSPTNSGKTYYVINEYIKYIPKDEYIILLVPYLTLLREIAVNENVYSLSEDKEFDINMAREKRVIVATYNKLYTIINAQNDFFSLNQSHIFIDEAHNLYTSHDYRYDILNNMYNVFMLNEAYKKLILMSGTFNKAYFPDDFIKNEIYVKRVDNTVKKTCILVENKSNQLQSAVDKIVEIYDEDNSRQQILYINDKHKSKNIKNDLSKQKNLKILELNASTSKNPEIQEIYKTNKIPNDINLLIMTKIGEEGISFNNEIYAIHTVGEVDSTVAEQLGNRPRKNPAILYVHYLEKKNNTYAINTSYKSLEVQYDKKMKLIHQDKKAELLKLEHYEKEKFKEFTIFDEYTNKIVFAPLIISSDLYEDDKKNEFGFYNYYFKKKMEHFGWEVIESNNNSETQVKLKCSENSRNELLNKIKILINYFKEFRVRKADSKEILELEDFVIFVKEKSLDYDKLISEAVFNDYGYLSRYITDDEIIKAIADDRAKDKTYKRLFAIIDNYKKDSNSLEYRMAQFITNKIKVGDILTNDSLNSLIPEYVEELNKYVPKRKEEKISIEKFNNILKNYFSIETKNKKTDGKVCQVTIIKKQHSIKEIEIDLEKDVLVSVTDSSLLDRFISKTKIDTKTIERNINENSKRNLKLFSANNISSPFVNLVSDFGVKQAS